MADRKTKKGAGYRPPSKPATTPKKPAEKGYRPPPPPPPKKPKS